MVLVQIFAEPIPGGPSNRPMTEFEWSISGPAQTDKDGRYVRVGCWDANHWRHVACSKTVKQTLGNLRRYLSNRAKRAGVSCTFEYRGDK